MYVSDYWSSRLMPVCKSCHRRNGHWLDKTPISSTLLTPLKQLQGLAHTLCRFLRSGLQAFSPPPLSAFLDQALAFCYQPCYYLSDNSINKNQYFGGWDFDARMWVAGNIQGSYKGYLTSKGCVDPFLVAVLIFLCLSASIPLAYPGILAGSITLLDIYLLVS